MKQLIKEYFVFSKKERTAAFVLLFFLVALLLLPFCYTPKEQILPTDAAFEKKVAQLMDTKLDTANTTTTTWQPQSDEPDQYTLFAFNPNKLDAEGWRKLGLKDKTIRTIFNYLGKGGHFYKAEDIRKIWGLSPEIADRIIPYAQVETGEKKFNSSSSLQWNKATRKPFTIPDLDINTATIEQLRAINQLDIGLAYRILKFRDRLGGFISIDQIKETHGITDTSFMILEPYLKKSLGAVAKININTASDDDLGNHPYINKALAKAIVFYRTKYGQYTSIADLKRIVFLKEEVLQKIAPYLTTQ